jgi:hypothetical protein
VRVALLLVAALALFAVAVWVVAPIVAERVADGVLATMPGYDAGVERAELTRRGIALDGVRVVRPGVEPPFVEIERVEIQPRLREWLRGDRAVAVAVDGITVNWIRGVDAARSQTAIDADWIRRQARRLPVDLDRVTVRVGAFHYRDRAASPDVHVVVESLWAEATGLSEPPLPDERLPGRIEVRARVAGQGSLSATASLDALASEPTFVLDSHLADVPLVALDDALRAYAGLDVSSGLASVTSRVDASGGRYHVVARSEIEGLEVVGRGEARHEGELDTTVRVSGELGDRPALVELLEVLPAAWFGSLVRATSAAGASAEETAEGAAAAARAGAQRR